MTWTTHHRRAEVLRDVVAAVDSRRDGTLPMDVPGVTETFGDELTLLGALQLRWHTRLNGRIEQALADQPLDLEAAVVEAWQDVARQMPGTRAVLDHHLAAPRDDAMEQALTRAVGKEHEMLALMAGLASDRGEASRRAGAAIAHRARTTYVEVPRPRPGASHGLMSRLRAVLAA